MNTQTPALPKEVRLMMEDLERETGVAPTLDTTRRGRYHLVHGNDRIRVEVQWTRNSQGRLSYSSRLYQDGDRRKNVKDRSSYCRLFKNPDLEHPDRTPTNGLPALHPLPEGHELPPLVAAMADKLTEAAPQGSSWTLGFQPLTTSEPAPKKGAELRFLVGDSQPDTTAYAVEVVKANGDKIQLYLEPVKPGSKVYHLGGMGAVDKDHGDLMDEFESLHDAVQRLLGFRMPSSTDSLPPPRQRPNTAGAASNAVTVRRATVIRV